ncbi:MAG TPA: sigma-54 dependent transcriptional regulator [Polyangiales bacterium]|nr:sigma-54 dependent transcriptional regulator [Polyangiales bacterium]
MSAAEPQAIVLIVDDKPNMLRLMAKVLRDDARVLTAERGEDAIGILEAEPVDVVLCDVRMPGVDGIQVLQASKRLRPRCEVVLMTAYASVSTAVDALRLGAFDYLTKPFEPEAARAVVRRALGRCSEELAASLPQGEEVLPGVIAASEPMRELSAMLRRVAQSDATAVLLGETGTGKERLARAIHRLSPRAAQRFVAVNCAAIPSELLESEVFGYRKGAFTGAMKDHAGLFEEAHTGTLFLDEIGEMGLPLQAKLTRALEERAVRRVGDVGERPIDVRLIVATHRDLDAMVRDGTFRQDLWYRLNVAVLRVPPLRERPDDIELLASHFLRERLAVARGQQVTGFAESALDALLHYDWPGNVRQLRAAVERASIVATGSRIEVSDLPPEIAKATVRQADPTSALGELSWTAALEKGREEIAQRYLQEVLDKYDGRVSDAAAHAGVERESFYRLMRRYNVELDVTRTRRVSRPPDR